MYRTLLWIQIHWIRIWILNFDPIWIRSFCFHFKKKRIKNNLTQFASNLSYFCLHAPGSVFGIRIRKGPKHEANLDLEPKHSPTTCLLTGDNGAGRGLTKINLFHIKLLRIRMLANFHNPSHPARQRYFKPTVDGCFATSGWARFSYLMSRRDGVTSSDSGDAALPPSPLLAPADFTLAGGGYADAVNFCSSGDSNIFLKSLNILLQLYLSSFFT